MKRLLLIALGLAAGLVPTAAFVVQVTSSNLPTRWNLQNPSVDVHTNVVNRTTRAIRFSLATDGYSTTNTAAELNAIRAAFAQWQAVPGTALKFEEGGPVGPGVDVDVPDSAHDGDHTNVVFWAKTNLFVYGGMANISGVLAVTFPSLNESNELLEADIVFNGSGFFKWTTDYFAPDPGSPTYFIEYTALHEIGHLLGLDHSPVGGATMFARGNTGPSSFQGGLSGDEIAFARSVYAATGTGATVGGVKGTVKMNGVGIFAAGVYAEDEATGNLVTGTVTREDGTYVLPGLTPGNYSIRVTPLDPDISNTLVKGRDISEFAPPDYRQAVTAFLPVPGVHRSVSAGITNTMDFTVTNQVAPLRVNSIRVATNDPNSLGATPSTVTIKQGQQNVYLGVFSPDFDSNCVLSITGGGIEVGPTVLKLTAGPQKLLRVLVNVATNATPGLRTFVVQRGTNFAYANGFLEIAPLAPDFNFDGLDDTFQRRYFPLFTAAEAGPGVDPDHDGFSNLQEYIAGTVPTNSLSVLKIESALQNSSGTTISWQGTEGKNYQVQARDVVTGTAWQVIGSTTSTNYLDASATNQMRFYRVAALP